MTVQDDWPLLQIPACKFSDDDIAFHSDITYFRALLNDIWELAYANKFANPFPITMADELDAATEALKAVKW